MLYQDSISFGNRLPNEVLQKNGSLVITNVDERNVGEYECSVLSRNSPKVLHKVVFPSKPKIVSLTAANDKTEVRKKILYYRKTHSHLSHSNQYTSQLL